MGNLASNDILISREKAASCGLSRFYTGRSCKAGHQAARYVSNKHCVECNAEKAKNRESYKCTSDPSYRAYRSVQRRSGQVLQGRASASQALSCGHRKLRNHIENLFTEGMCWEKYGQWEVDHILPLSKAKTLEEQILLCNYTNLQPLWKRDNLIKGNRI